MSGTSGDAPRGTETRCPPAYTWVPGRVCALSSKGAFVSPSTLHYRSLRPRPVPCTHDIPDIEYTGDEVVRCTRLAGDVTYVHARDGTLYVGQITNGPDAKGVTIFDWAGDRDTAYPIIGIGVIAGVASPYDESDVLYAVMQEDARCELYTVARGVGLYPHWQPEPVKEVITAMASTADRVYIALQRTDKMESGPKEGMGVQQIVVVLGADGRVLARHELPNVATGNKRTAAYYSASACGNYAVLSNGMFMVFVDDAGVAASRIDTPLECITALPERRVAAMRQDGAVVLFKPTIDDREPEGHTIVWLTALRWQAMPLSLEYVRRVDPLVGEHGRPFPPHDRMPEIERRPRLLYDDTTDILYVGTMHGYVYRVPVTAKAVAALDETQWPLVRRGDLTDAFVDIARDELAKLYVGDVPRPFEIEEDSRALLRQKWPRAYDDSLRAEALLLLHRALAEYAAQCIRVHGDGDAAAAAFQRDVCSMVFERRSEGGVPLDVATLSLPAEGSGVARAVLEADTNHDSQSIRRLLADEWGIPDDRDILGAKQMPPAATLLLACTVVAVMHLRIAEPDGCVELRMRTLIASDVTQRMMEAVARKGLGAELSALARVDTGAARALVSAAMHATDELTCVPFVTPAGPSLFAVTNRDGSTAAVGRGPVKDAHDLEEAVTRRIEMLCGEHVLFWRGHLMPVPESTVLLVHAAIAKAHLALCSSEKDALPDDTALELNASEARQKLARMAIAEMIQANVGRLWAIGLEDYVQWHVESYVRNAVPVLIEMARRLTGPRAARYVHLLRQWTEPGREQYKMRAMHEVRLAKERRQGRIGK